MESRYNPRVSRPGIAPRASAPSPSVASPPKVAQPSPSPAPTVSATATPSTSESSFKVSKYYVFLGIAIVVIAIAFFMFKGEKPAPPKTVYQEPAVQKAAFSKTIKALSKDPITEGFIEEIPIPISRVNEMVSNKKFIDFLDAMDVATKGILTKDELDSMCYPTAKNPAERFSNIFKNFTVAINNLNRTANMNNEEKRAFASIATGFLSSAHDPDRALSPLTYKEDDKGNVIAVTLPPDWLKQTAGILSQWQKATSPYVKLLIKSRESDIKNVINEYNTNPTKGMTINEDVFVDLMVIWLGIMSSIDTPPIFCFKFVEGSGGNTGPSPPSSPQGSNNYPPASFFAKPISALNITNYINKSPIFENSDANKSVLYQSVESWIPDIDSNAQSMFGSMVGYTSLSDKMCIQDTSTFVNRYMNAYIKFYEAIHRVQNIQSISEDEFINLATLCCMFIALYGDCSQGLINQTSSGFALKSPFAVDILCLFLATRSISSLSPGPALTAIIRQMEPSIDSYQSQSGMLSSFTVEELRSTFNSSIVKEVPIHIFILAVMWYMVISVSLPKSVPFPSCESLLSTFGYPAQS